MGMSNFPNGFSGGVSVRGLPLYITAPGKVFFVNNSSVIADGGIGGSNTNDGSYKRPFSTIAYAITKCTANRGDVILVMPGHSEAITTAGGIAMSVAGVSIIGLGHGDKMAAITWGAAAATLTVSAANCSIENMRLTPNFLNVTKMIDLTAKYFSLKSCLIKDAGASLNCVDVISATGAANTADGVVIEDCTYVSPSTSNDSFIKFAAAVADIKVKNNYFGMGVNNNKAVVSAGANAITNMHVEGNRLARLNTDSATGALLVNSSTTCSGIISNNHIRHADTAAEVLNLAAGAGHFDNKGTAVDSTSGYLLPVVDS